MAVLDFPKECFLYPKRSKNWMLYLTFYKTQIFQIFQTTVQCVVAPCLDISLANFQVDISIFGKHTAQKPYPLMTSFFETAILSISRNCTEIKCHFWNPEIKLVQKHNFLFEKKINSKIWPYVTRGWPDPSLPSSFTGSDCKMASFFEFYVQKWL